MAHDLTRKDQVEPVRLSRRPLLPRVERGLCGGEGGFEPAVRLDPHKSRKCGHYSEPLAQQRQYQPKSTGFPLTGNFGPVCLMGELQATTIYDSAVPLSGLALTVP